MPKFSKYIIERIIKLRKASGFSQAEVARKAGITSSAISQIEKGRNPSLEVIIKLANIFNVCVSEITGDVVISQARIDRFFRKFGDIERLNKSDQNLIQSIVKRLLKEEK